MPMLKPGITANSILLEEHETTGPLPVGFEFERYGAVYDHFDVSTEGFITFVGRARRGTLADRVRVVEEKTRLGRGRVTYEVVGPEPRRRLVVSLAQECPLGTRLQVTVHERTGIVEVGGRQSLGEPTIRQLDIVQSSPSRANSARKIG